MCFLISPIYTSVAVIIILVLAIVLHFRSVPAEWGSISQALIFHQVISITIDMLVNFIPVLNYIS